MTTRRYAVLGLTCEHCVHAVRTELRAVPGVTAVEVDLDAAGASTVTVTSEVPLTDAQLTAALDEAGDYRLLPVEP